MYCPNCAAQYSYGLKYCKHCGTNLGESAPAAAPPPPKVTGAAWALAMATVAIVLAGLGIVFSFAFDLARPTFGNETPRGDATPVALAMLILGTLLIGGVVYMLVRLFGHVIAPRAQAQVPEAQPGKSLTAAPAAVQLPAPPPAVGSVTEHTTRNFDPSVYDKARARE